MPLVQSLRSLWFWEALRRFPSHREMTSFFWFFVWFHIFFHSFSSCSFFLFRLYFTSINLSSDLTWHTVMHGLVLLMSSNLVLIKLVNRVCRTTFIHLLILLDNLLAFKIGPISVCFTGIILDDVPLNWLKYFLFSRLIDCVISLTTLKRRLC